MWLPMHLTGTYSYMPVLSSRGYVLIYTGRNCDDPDCQGPLKDTIINFGENLPEDELTKAFAEGNAADLCIVLGSSCTVTPAASIPQVCI